MGIFFISDTHFGHANVIKYSQRPYSSVEEMNEAMISNWNAIVKPNDIVWHLGDFSFSNLQETIKVIDRLNGKINLVLGNHDKMIVKNAGSLLNSKKFSSIQHYAELKHDRQFIVMFHYGMRVWNKSHYGSIHLFGHSHNSLPPHGKSVDVGIDSKEITSEYRPVSIDEIFQYMNRREITIVDHHGVKDDFQSE